MIIGNRTTCIILDKGIEDAVQVSKNSRDVKMRFLTIIDGVADFITPSFEGVNSYLLGICRLDYNGKDLHIHLRRPGLLISKKGATIKAIMDQLGINIIIHEVNFHIFG